MYHTPLLPSTSLAFLRAFSGNSRGLHSSLLCWLNSLPFLGVGGDALFKRPPWSFDHGPVSSFFVSSSLDVSFLLWSSCKCLGSHLTVVLCGPINKKSLTLAKFCYLWGVLKIVSRDLWTGNIFFSLNILLKDEHVYIGAF